MVGGTGFLACAFLQPQRTRRPQRLARGATGRAWKPGLESESKNEQRRSHLSQTRSASEDWPFGRMRSVSAFSTPGSFHDSCRRGVLGPRPVMPSTGEPDPRPHRKNSGGTGFPACAKPGAPILDTDAHGTRRFETRCPLSGQPAPGVVSRLSRHGARRFSVALVWLVDHATGGGGSSATGMTRGVRKRPCSPTMRSRASSQ